MRLTAFVVDNEMVLHSRKMYTCHPGLCAIKSITGLHCYHHCRCRLCICGIVSMLTASSLLLSSLQMQTVRMWHRQHPHSLITSVTIIADADCAYVASSTCSQPHHFCYHHCRCRLCVCGIVNILTASSLLLPSLQMQTVHMWHRQHAHSLITSVIIIADADCAYVASSTSSQPHHLLSSLQMQTVRMWHRQHPHSLITSVTIIADADCAYVASSACSQPHHFCYHHCRCRLCVCGIVNILTASSLLLPSLQMQTVHMWHRQHAHSLITSVIIIADADCAYVASSTSSQPHHFCYRHCRCRLCICGIVSMLTASSLLLSSLQMQTVRMWHRQHPHSLITSVTIIADADCAYVASSTCSQPHHFCYHHCRCRLCICGIVNILTASSLLLPSLQMQTVHMWHRQHAHSLITSVIIIADADCAYVASSTSSQPHHFCYHHCRCRLCVCGIVNILTASSLLLPSLQMQTVHMWHRQHAQSLITSVIIIADADCAYVASSTSSQPHHFCYRHCRCRLCICGIVSMLTASSLLLSSLQMQTVRMWHRQHPHSLITSVTIIADADCAYVASSACSQPHHFCYHHCRCRLCVCGIVNILTASSLLLPSLQMQTVRMWHPHSLITSVIIIADADCAYVASSACSQPHHFCYHHCRCRLCVCGIVSIVTASSLLLPSLQMQTVHMWHRQHPHSLITSVTIIADADCAYVASSASSQPHHFCYHHCRCRLSVCGIVSILTASSLLLSSLQMQTVRMWHSQHPHSLITSVTIIADADCAYVASSASSQPHHFCYHYCRCRLSVCGIVSILTASSLLLSSLQMQTVRMWHRQHPHGLIINHQDGWKLAYSGDTTPSEFFAKAGEIFVWT